MIIKKKLAKKTTAKKAAHSLAKKSNRGRPRKEFKSKHKRLQEQALITTTIVEHRLPTHERIFRMPSKDKSIFYLFIFSIALFLFSLAISFIKKDDIKQLQEIQDENTAITAETGIDTATEQTAITSAAQTVENMYGTINACVNCVNYRDVSIKNSNTVKTYFSTKRLTRFLGGIKDGSITISDVHQEQIKDYSWKVDYKLSYTLLDGQPFEEERSATVLRKDDVYTIASIKCETAGCSRMPFFNPGKYGIK
ncbi:MAG: hypothetical protein CO170_03265 [candidate division SR1 bacterium CG_4_9_14_3_um_filter_40_9]|nr:MAG: hypothetical protein CO170_03265 [candidate division SR1 bacterium CG_4_9_14_3_um_filter_40_9]